MEEFLTQEEQATLAPVLVGLSGLFTDNTHRMADYDKNRYMPAVRDLVQTYAPIVKVYDEFCKEHPEKTEAAADACAIAFMKQVKEFVEGRLRGKKWRDRITMEQYRMVMAAFVVPSLKEMKAENGQLLIDRICRGWKRAYPDFPFQQTTADVLENGFKLKFF